jgi:hypothetical protein
MAWWNQYDQKVKEKVKEEVEKKASSAFVGTTKVDTVEKESGYSVPRPFQYVEDNVLHKYASYNYIFTLSALSRSQLQNPSSILNDPPHDIVARTGGIGDNQRFGDEKWVQDSIFAKVVKAQGSGSQVFEIPKEDPTLTGKEAEFAKTVLKRNRDIYFERVEIDARPTFNSERKMMTFMTVDFTLSEPNGISLWQKLRGAAANNGFKNWTQAPFLLTIEFKGFDSKGVESSITKRHIPIKLATSNMQINAGGTNYNLKATPWTDFAKTNAYLYTRGSGKISAYNSSLENYLISFANSLNANMQQEVDDGIREFADEYFITADSSIGYEGGAAQAYAVLKEEQTRLQELKNVYSGSVGSGRGAGSDKAKESGPITSGYTTKIDVVGKDKGKPTALETVNYKNNQSIAKILEDLVKQFDMYSDIAGIAQKYWLNAAGAQADYLEMPSPWVPWFKIVTTVTDLPEFDTKLKSHRRKIHFHIKPFKIHIANFARAGMGVPGEWLNNTRKVYDYIYTGRNQDVLDLNIDYNTAFSQAMVVDNTEQSSNVLLKTALNAFQKISRLFGLDRNFPSEDLPLSQFPSTSRSEYDSIFKLDNQAQIQQFYDFLTNPQGDMVKVDMKIMGDPAFIGQDMTLPLPTPESSGYYNALDKVASINGIDWDPKYKAFNFDNNEVNVKLNFKFPDDFNESQGLYNFNGEESPVFTGVYRVNGVLSVFENGQFTQTLTMNRHLNQGTYAGLTTETARNPSSETLGTPDNPNPFGEGAA